jgi:glycogen debranching enzyme
MLQGARRWLPLDPAERERLLGAARAVLDANWQGSSTVPSRSLYPHQWSWDSAFHAIGLAWYDQSRAQQELETLFAAQWGNGMVPHIVFNPSVPDDVYFPGPGFWQSGRSPNRPAGVQTSGITQPPLHARAALEVYRRAGDRSEALAFLRRLYPRLAAQHAYLATRRDPEGHGLAAIVHPWESGMDNSPAWDDELDELVIPPGALPVYHRYDLEHAQAADRPSDQAYDRFVYLAIGYRDAGYDDAHLLQTSPFLVEGPLFNSIWLWSCRALARIAELVGEDPAPHRAMATRIHLAMLARLWDPEAGRFCTRTVREGRRGHQGTIMSFMPLLDGELPRSVALALAAGLDSPAFHPAGGRDHFLVPSYDLRGPGFDPRRYWRGPVWLNTDWLLWCGLRQHGVTALAEEIAASMLALVQRSGFREYFDPFSGAGHGADGFGWTAALLIDLLRRLAP